MAAIAWRKQGRLFVPSGEGFFKTHATRPITCRLSDEVIRVYFSSRDHDDRMLPTYIDVEADNPAKTIRVAEQPLIGLGEPGTFDDCGVTLASVVDDGRDEALFY